MATPFQLSDPAVPELLRARMLDRVEERLRGLLAAEHSATRVADPRAVTPIRALADQVTAGGERTRATLLLTGYLAAGGSPAGSQVIDVAAALELLDTCHLIRGDVRDNVPLRRGIPTPHVGHAAEHERNGWRGEPRRFGEATATLAGDLAVAYADRLVGGLPGEARAIWDQLRIARVLGAHAEAATRTEYLDDPWPLGCLEGCTPGCAAGWYAVREPLLLGAALAGRPDLADEYADYAGRLHAAWRLRGFLDSGAASDWHARMLCEILLGREEKDRTEDLIMRLVNEADLAVAEAPLRSGWHRELVNLAARLALAGAW
ncbi:polyprenyl synthetase family protein [Kitasatospora sp. P5_F3]